MLKTLFSHIVMLRHIIHIVFVTLLVIQAQAQSPTATKRQLSRFFNTYENPAYTCRDKAKVEKFLIRKQCKEVEIVVSEVFLGQPFTNELVASIYRDVRKHLPQPYATWKVIISVNGYPIEKLVPAKTLPSVDASRFWGATDYQDIPWTTTLSRPFSIPNGLQGRHLAVWASHGRYYDFRTEKWRWQRPGLFGTCEDILTNSIVLPMLMPMLENAGAIVFSPRERDIQVNEAIVDNDRPGQCGSYKEDNGRNKWMDCGQGFAHWREYYRDTQNPFLDGTARIADVQTEESRVSTVTWTPNIPEDGRYAVYVSYKTLPTSVPDAVYTVRHQGIDTQVRVNQRMGGGTWVYLGTFEFNKGESSDCCVTLTNHSSHRGHVTADAVRFGGGMGNIARGNASDEYQPVSGLPRFLEGARYYMHWAGAPYEVYSSKGGTNDYADDINSRSHGLNYLARGSVFMPNDTLDGLRVPIEMSLGIHTDAGLRDNMDIIGTLGVYTTQYYDKVLATGMSRLSSRDLADGMLARIHKDMTFHFGKWTRRSLFDRNYSESREPQVPSMILEMLSHQNFADMLVAHDPYCKFVLARAIYKSVLEYNATVHQRKTPTVQPLPVCNLAAIANPKEKNITLSWAPQRDPLEPSATPTSYIIYIRQNDRGWENGIVVNSNAVNISATPGTLYRFRVAALNDGGSSMQSEEVCARVPFDKKAHSVMIANGFERLAAPQAVVNDTTRNFDINIDPGVAYYTNTSIYELNGMPVAGNTFDYPTMHAKDLLLTDTDMSAHRDLAISSCMVSAIPHINLGNFTMLDLILGAQRYDGYSHKVYQTFPEYLQEAIAKYASVGGNILVSGAYVGEDLRTSEQRDFAYNTLKYMYDTPIRTDNMKVTGMGTEFSLNAIPNADIYTTARINAITPASGAFTTLLLNETQTTYRTEISIAEDGTETSTLIPQTSIRQASGAVAYQGEKYKSITFGFPLETIENKDIRRAIINASFQFLCTK